MKKLLTLFLSVLFAFGAVGLIGCGEKMETVSTENISSPEMFLTIGESRLLSGTLPDGQEGVYVSKVVTATISPSTVADKYVTWSLAWANDAALKDSDISEYLQVTQETEGELTANVNCYKSFRGSKAILTCTTRQGNKTATCEVTFDGLPSSMSITPTTTLGQYRIGPSTTVDLLYDKETYQLNIALDNVFHDVGSSFNDFVVTVSGVGTINCDTYYQGPISSGWSGKNTIINLNDIVSEFVTASITINTVQIQVNKSIYEYYESVETKYNAHVQGDVTTYTNKFYSMNYDYNSNCPYFVITVTHRNLEFSLEYKFFIEEQVSSVSMNSSTITF